MTLLKRGKLDIKQALVCSVCDTPVYDCDVCGNIFVNNESVFCDDDGHHFHLDCIPVNKCMICNKPINPHDAVYDGKCLECRQKG